MEPNNLLRGGKPRPPDTPSVQRLDGEKLSKSK